MILIMYHPWEKTVTLFFFFAFAFCRSAELQSRRSNFSKKELPSASWDAGVGDGRITRCTGFKSPSRDIWEWIFSWRRFLVVTAEGCYWRLAGRGQECYGTSYNAQDIPPKQNYPAQNIKCHG